MEVICVGRSRKILLINQFEAFGFSSILFCILHKSSREMVFGGKRKCSGNLHKILSLEDRFEEENEKLSQTALKSNKSNNFFVIDSWVQFWGFYVT